MNWKGYGRKQVWPEVLSQHMLAGIEENYEKLM
jgi:hypothetical protein